MTQEYFSEMKDQNPHMEKVHCVYGRIVPEWSPSRYIAW